MTPEEFAQALTEKFAGERYASRVFTVTRGPRYTKIVQAQSVEDFSSSAIKDRVTLGGSVYCFVEESTGNVFKPASWSRPAKGVRYTSLEEALDAADVYGGFLYRRWGP